jgi:hypothetical protein
VGLDEVQEHEGGTLGGSGTRLRPLLEASRDRRASLVRVLESQTIEQPVDEAEASTRSTLGAQRFVLIAEAPGESESVTDPRIGGDAEGLVAISLENLGEGREAVIQVAVLGVGTVARGIAAREERRVGGQ